jgi:hypothetical protein
MTFNLVEHLERQRAFSAVVFGPGDRRHGIVDHIRKELQEIEAAPWDTEEWVDVILLALDGAWRTGAESVDIVAALRDALGPWPSELDRPLSADENDLLLILRHLRYASITANGSREDRTALLCTTIRNNLDVIAASAQPALPGWIGVLILALEGAWRSCPYISCVADAIKAKQERNEARRWPDWREAPTDRAIEHIR